MSHQNHHQNHQSSNFNLIAVKSCKCSNPVVAKLNYLNVVSEMEIHQENWQIDVQAYLFYINEFNSLNGFSPIKTIDINNNIEWLKACTKCKGKLVHKLDENNQI